MADKISSFSPNPKKTNIYVAHSGKMALLSDNKSSNIQGRISIVVQVSEKYRAKRKKHLGV